jgi:putative FmdB family regulatory protein
MPLYHFACEGCENVVEELMKFSERDGWKDKHACANCGSDFVDKVTMPAKMAEQWAGWQEGLSSNMYSAALGRKVVNQREEAEIAKSMGFVAASDLPSNYVEDRTAAAKEEDAYFDKMNDAYQAKLTEGGGTYGAAIKAVEELMPAKQMLKEAEAHGD